MARAEPSGLELAARAVLDLARLPLREGPAIQRALADPGAALRQAGDALQGMAKMAGGLWPAPGSSLTGPIGRQRRYTWARASLDDVKTIKRELGGTVNDVVLAAISSGFRALLIARGEEPAPTMVPSLILVSVRNQGDESSYENRVSAIVANLPVHIAGPAERLAAVRTQLTELKESKESMAGEAVVTMGRLTPFPLASMFVRLAFSLPQREIVTVTTNIPGPQQPLYALGRELVEIIPYVPIATTLRIGVSIFTYNGKVTFGLTGDYGTTPDIAVLARASRTASAISWRPPKAVARGKRSRLGNPVRQGTLGGRILVVMKPARAATRRYLPNSPFNTPVATAPAKEFAILDLVTHDRYGLGRVTSVDEAAVLVDFGPTQVWIVAPYTKMTKL